MEEDDIYQAEQPYALAPPAWHTNGYHQPVYPWERNYAPAHGQYGTLFIKNSEYLIKLYDAAGFRLTTTGDLELLVKDSEGDTLIWVDITELEVPEPTEH